MIKSLVESLHTIRNPMRKVKNRFNRYIIITCCTGTFSFLVALVLLHAGFTPFLTLVISILASGLINYAAMELWAFPHRKGELSWRRLLQNGLVGVGGFTVRYVVLTAGLRYFNFAAPLDKAIPLALAYLASFVFGYFMRSRIVFKK